MTKGVVVEVKERTQYLSLLRAAVRLAGLEGLSDHVATLTALADEVRPVPTSSDPRVLARRLGSFTVREFQAALGRSRPTTMAVVERLIAQGIVRDSGLRRTHGGPGRPAPVYECVPIPSSPRNREKRPPPEIEVRHNFAKRSGGSVSGSGRGAKINNKEVRRMVEVARANGCRVELNGGHIRVFTPRGGMVSLPSTPSDHRSLLNARSEMRKAGVPV